MSVLVIVELKAKAGCVDELRALLSPVRIRAREGNEGAEVTVSGDDPDQLLLAEHWASREAFEVYRAAVDQAALSALIEGDVAVRVFDVVETVRPRRSKTRDEALEDLEEWAKRWLTLRAEIRALADQKLSAEHLGPVIKLHNEELDSIMSELAAASE